MAFYTNVARYGRNVLYRGYEDGKKIQKKVEFSPTLFMNSAEGKSPWRSLFGRPVEPIKFTNMMEARDFFKKYDGIEGFDIYGMEKFEYQYIIENFEDDIEYVLSQMGIWSIDIETRVPDSGGFPDIKTANTEILLISMQRKGSKVVNVFATKDYNPTGGVDLLGCVVDYRKFSDEASMLRAFVSFWSSDYPDIVTGWNTDTFDIPFIINRVNNVLGEEWMKRMSPWNMVREKKIEVRGEEIQVYELVGVSQLDYLQLYRKFSFTPQESYKLGEVALADLGMTKLDYEGSIRSFYENDWDRFVEYNIRDTQLVDRMDAKYQFIEMCIQMAYLARCNIHDVFSPVKTWDVFIYSQLHKKKIAIPQYRHREGGTIEGAYVKSPQLGMKKWSVSFDFAALYPRITQQWNISPETILHVKHALNVDMVLNDAPELDIAISDAISKNATLAVNGTMYSKEKLGIIPELMGMCLDGRKIAKNRMLSLEQAFQDTKDDSLLPTIAALNGKQLALKTLANSGYGAMCNVGFRYFMLAMGEAITLTGQFSNMHLENGFNSYFRKLLKNPDKDYVIYCDTDSNYIDVSDFIDEFFPNKTVDETVEFLIKCDPQFQKVVNKSIDTVFEKMNCYKKVMASKREAISSRGFWTTKKRYALKVHNSEGVSYDPPKIKVTGLDLVKTSTPKAVRGMLKKSLNVIFDYDEAHTQEYIEKCREDFCGLRVEEIAFPRGVSDVDKWVVYPNGYKSGCPIHVRAAIVYNNAIKRLDGKYQKISNGDKLRFVYLKEPNPLRENVIGIPADGHIPPELGLEKYIDRDLQFEKTFINPMSGMLNAIGWDVEPQSDLSAFFG